MYLNKFITARDNDDFFVLKNLIKNHWNDEYINEANQDILMDIAEIQPNLFNKIAYLLELDNLIFCLKYLNIDYLEFYNHLKGVMINWEYDGCNLSEISIIVKDKKYIIPIYENCIEPSLIKILNYTFNHKVFQQVLQENPFILKD